MKMINTLVLNRQITPTTTTTTTTTLFFSSLIKNPSHAIRTRHFYRLYPTPTPTRSTSLSLSLSASNAAFPPNSLNFPNFLSLSSNPNPNPQPPAPQNPNPDPSAAKFHTWHRPPAPGSAGAGGVGGGDKKEVAAVVLGWLGATQRHLRRYAEMYTSKGFNAVTFVAPVEEVMRDYLGRRVEYRVEMLANEIVSWLENGDGDGDRDRDRSLVFHTFSTTGWLVYGCILGHMQGRPDLIEKIKGCIVDSGGHPDLDPKVWAAGFGTALLKKRNARVSPLAEAKPGALSDNDKQKLQEKDPDILEAAVLFALEIMFTFLFKLPALNQKLSKIISHLSLNQPLCPQLYLYSTADKVIPYRSVESFMEQQKKRGINVKSFNFVSSPHVDHYRTFPDLYSSLVNSFLNDILATRKST